MAKALRQKLERKNRAHTAGAVHRWRFEQQGGRYVIEIFEDAEGWASVAVVTGTAGLRAEALAGYMVHVLNQKQQESTVLDEAVHALSELMKDGVTYGTEYDADRSVRSLQDLTEIFRQLVDTLELALEEGVTPATKKRADRTLAFIRDHRTADQF
jgi:hypothetical protein